MNFFLVFLLLFLDESVLLNEKNPISANFDTVFNKCLLYRSFLSSKPLKMKSRASRALCCGLSPGLPPELTQNHP